MGRKHVSFRFFRCRIDPNQTVLWSGRRKTRRVRCPKRTWSKRAKTVKKLCFPMFRNHEQQIGKSSFYFTLNSMLKLSQAFWLDCGAHFRKLFCLRVFVSRLRGRHFNFWPAGLQTEHIFVRVQTLRIHLSPRTQLSVRVSLDEENVIPCICLWLGVTSTLTLTIAARTHSHEDSGPC